MLKFKDTVRIKEGFYEGLIGTVINTTDSYEIGMGIRTIPTAYTVKFKDRYSQEEFMVTFSEKYLENIEGE